MKGITINELDISNNNKNYLRKLTFTQRELLYKDYQDLKLNYNFDNLTFNEYLDNLEFNKTINNYQVTYGIYVNIQRLNKIENNLKIKMM